MCVCDQVLGAKRKTLAGFSTATTQPHQGFIYNSDVIQQTPPALRGKASRMVGAKCTLLARMDAYGQDPSGQAGEAMKVLVPVSWITCRFKNKFYFMPKFNTVRLSRLSHQYTLSYTLLVAPRRCLLLSLSALFSALLFLSVFSSFLGCKPFLPCHCKPCPTEFQPGICFSRLCVTLPLLPELQSSPS